LTELEQLLASNERFAKRFTGADLTAKARLPFVILSCVDQRTSPVHFFELELGDALVMRTVGGRVTDGVEAELGVLWFMLSRTSDDPPDLNVAVVHHTECGMQKISSNEARAALSEFMGTDRYSALYPAPDPEESVRFDVERLRNSPLVPEAVSITGFVFDVRTGRLRQIVDG
jgi:carbonic anhydrase